MTEKEEKSIISTDPFLCGRTEAADRYGHLARNAAQWRRISLVLVLCCAACVFAIIYTANTVTVVPYIVVLDKLEQIVPLGPIEPSKVDSRLIVSSIARYIWSLKTVFNDSQAQLYLLNFIYNSTLVNTTAETKYKEYYREDKDWLEARKTKTSIHTTVNSVLPIGESENTWQAQWTENAYQNGRKLWTKQYQGIFETAINTPKTMDEVIANPLGIYITNFSFSEKIGGQSK